MTLAVPRGPLTPTASRLAAARIPKVPQVQRPVILEFVGHLPPDSFAEFAAHRADRLSLAHEILEQDGTRAVVRLSGPEPLVAAFEMALGLGPSDCLVRDIRRLDPDR